MIKKFGTFGYIFLLSTVALLFTGKSVNENPMNRFFNLLLNDSYVDEDVPRGKILKITLSDWLVLCTSRRRPRSQ